MCSSSSLHAPPQSLVRRRRHLRQAARQHCLPQRRMRPPAPSTLPQPSVTAPDHPALQVRLPVAPAVLAQLCDMLEILMLCWARPTFNMP